LDEDVAPNIQALPNNLPLNNDDLKSDLRKNSTKRRKTILDKRAAMQESGLNSSRVQYDESKISNKTQKN
jgi:hypothetical protein